MSLWLVRIRVTEWSVHSKECVGVSKAAQQNPREQHFYSLHPTDSLSFTEGKKAGIPGHRIGVAQVAFPAVAARSARTKKQIFVSLLLLVMDCSCIIKSTRFPGHRVMGGLNSHQLHLEGSVKVAVDVNDFRLRPWWLTATQGGSALQV